MTSNLERSIHEEAMSLLRKHRISPKTGFLGEWIPCEFPSRSRFPQIPRILEPSLTKLGKIACSLPTIIRDKQVASTVAGLDILPWPPETHDLPEHETTFWAFDHRLMLIYAMLTHAYFHELLRYKNVSELMQDTTVKLLPPQLAIPLWRLHKLTGIAPSMSYALYASWNYQKENPARPISLSNIKLLHSFSGTRDEEWFVNIHQVIEARVAPQIIVLTKAYLLSKVSDPPIELMIKYLGQAAQVENRALDTLERMREHCDYKTYFDRVRLFYALPRNVVFEGVEELGGTPQEIFGESGWQSASRYLRIVVMGIDHSADPYYRKMLDHISAPHREFLQLIADSKIRDFVLAHKSNRRLARRNNAMIWAIIDWSDEHLSLVHDYITPYGESHGTGKPPLDWLVGLREKRKQYLID